MKFLIVSAFLVAVATLASSYQVQEPTNADQLSSYLETHAGVKVSADDIEKVCANPDYLWRELNDIFQQAEMWCDEYLPQNQAPTQNQAQISVEGFVQYLKTIGVEVTVEALAKASELTPDQLTSKVDAAMLNLNDCDDTKCIVDIAKADGIIVSEETVTNALARPDVLEKVLGDIRAQVMALHEQLRAQAA